MPLLEALYYSTAPWGGWDSDTPGHAAIREAAATYGQDPHGAYIAGWTWQYPWLTLLEQATASGDLTRANVSAIAQTLDGIDYQGILPTGTYVGDPADFHVRSSYVNKADSASSDGLTPVTDFFTSEVAANFDFAAPCFVG